MSASTAPDFYPVVKGLPRVAAAPGATLELLVLAADRDHCAGVDLGSGALVRAWMPDAPAHLVRLRMLRPYDVVTVTLGQHLDDVPDPQQPESLRLATPPQRVRRLTGRRVERMLRRLLHPPGQPLLGVAASAVPLWDRRRDHPSIAVVNPEGPISLCREGPDLACRFLWLGRERELPCLDRFVASAMDRSGRTLMQASKGDRLLIALTPPIDGRCHKVVEAVLPRP